MVFVVVVVVVAVQVQIKVKHASDVEVFDLTTLNTAADGIFVRVVKLSRDGSVTAGWTSDLTLDWKTYPDTYDLSSLPRVMEYPLSELVGLDASDPIQMSSASTTDDCAQVCLQNPECKVRSPVFFFNIHFFALILLFLLPWILPVVHVCID